MKKILILVIACLCVLNLDAQVRWGIKGGANFNSMSSVNVGDVKSTFKNNTGFNAGLVLQVRVPLIGLAFQPELLYTSKGVTSDKIGPMPGDGQKYRLDYLELPVNIQWGINLLLFRPYIQVSPYVSYAINKFGEYSKVNWDSMNRFDYGIGIGAGIEIWKFQISGKYSWSLAETGISTDKSIDIDDIAKGAKMRGFELSLALLF